MKKRIKKKWEKKLDDLSFINDIIKNLKNIELVTNGVTLVAKGERFQSSRNLRKDKIGIFYKHIENS